MWHCAVPLRHLSYLFRLIFTVFHSFSLLFAGIKLLFALFAFQYDQVQRAVDCVATLQLTSLPTSSQLDRFLLRLRCANA